MRNRFFFMKRSPIGRLNMNEFEDLKISCFSCGLVGVLKPFEYSYPWSIENVQRKRVHWCFHLKLIEDLTDVRIQQLHPEQNFFSLWRNVSLCQFRMPCETQCYENKNTETFPLRDQQIYISTRQSDEHEHNIQCQVRVRHSELIENKHFQALKYQLTC